MADKQLYSYEDVIIDPVDPRVEIGAEYYFSWGAQACIEYANSGRGENTLDGVDKSGEYNPFITDEKDYPFIIRKKEPKKKHVPFDLSKPEVRDRLRGKWFYYPSTDSELMIDCFSHMDSQWRVHGLTADQFLNACTFLDGSPCGQEVAE